MMAVTSTDDLLCSYNPPGVFYGFRIFIKMIVPTIYQGGNLLKCLNFRIVQSENGISIDQTEHIKKNVIDTYFPLNGQEIIKSADTPFRTDSQYETDLAEQAPATNEERIHYKNYTEAHLMLRWENSTTSYSSQDLTLLIRTVD